jgi:hypothetical protein
MRPDVALGMVSDVLRNARCPFKFREPNRQMADVPEKLEKYRRPG